MKKKYITGIILISSLITLIILFLLILSQGEMVKASYVKYAMANLSLIFIAAGIYLIDVFTPEIARKMKMILIAFGSFCFVLAVMASMNMIAFLENMNWVIVMHLFFILMIQLQLLHWGKRVPQVTRFSALFIILSDALLIFFFVAKWKDFHLASPISIAAIVSVSATLLGMIFLKEKKQTETVESSSN
ncbi:MAG: hypothetical protein IPM77_08810 [Crocinitomicaceae bacterium]|nr:hypothetical protein [Crocinitomicaceae bacterium]